MRIRRIANWDLSGLGQSIPEAGGDSDTPDLIVTVPAGGKTTNGAALFGWFVVGEVPANCNVTSFGLVGWRYSQFSPQ
ncbi:hypothetical protein BDQ94DRAFT_81920 [Aspergillus welwitschiae]|uniref:Uncharacterized protein n=2 Tax=Aspergillus TaxID=5052 RepID=A0A3F3PS13_9EURO|nr:uncharacterized protein BO96DRAFT_408526 [Aspergillus niger CBS 101883]XP_026622640.1 hypothetical protein BDQ94DRAFT_81920 [Aspergillus welwitschiae]PYH60347.1 hypothetical protein BO96DRAFT_408526 [Aspergillus niger CBS 101883]RDH29618.1 hypothetical protein BDQ94DRAFT_81920 [Aspergillus welwitschiae]RDK44742.1 hypothetical protein M752DRAFT_274063 [Aspergillus phoenicis ATCC 13157]